MHEFKFTASPGWSAISISTGESYETEVASVPFTLSMEEEQVEEICEALYVAGWDVTGDSWGSEDVEGETYLTGFVEQV